MANTFGFGIIGAGVISSFHAQAIKAQPEGRLVAVSSRGMEKTEKLAADNDCDVMSDWREMIRRDDIDAVSICTPSGLHAEQAIAAAEAGKHIIVEKPMAITMNDAVAMVRAARNNNVKLGVIFQRRTEEASNRIKNAVAKGLFGRMIFGDASIKYWRNQAYYDSGAWRGTWALDGGGCSMNQGIHGIDLLLYMMGDVERVYAKTATVSHDIEVEDIALGIVTYKNGAYGCIETSTSANPPSGNRFQLNGTLGSATLVEDTLTSWAVSDSAEILAEETIEYSPGKADDSAASNTQLPIDGFIAQIGNLISAVRTGEELICSGEEGMRSLGLILAMYESAKRGEEVYLDELYGTLNI